KVHVIYAHPVPESLNAAAHQVVVETLTAKGWEVDDCDLYAEGFDPVLSEQERRDYHNTEINLAPVQGYVDRLRAADAVVFCHPIWNFGLPAILKGWHDRVLLPDIAFKMPQHEGETIKPGLQHIKRLGVFTTCGASRWLTMYIGAPGRRTLLRGVGLLLAPRARKVFAAHYLMDTAPRPSLERHLTRVAMKTDKLIAYRAPTAQGRVATT
ncbi:MAG: NAD(P)H-dependent oxidoreductase, partial [Pseudomonadota bacterium]